MLRRLTILSLVNPEVFGALGFGSPLRSAHQDPMGIGGSPMPRKFEAGWLRTAWSDDLRRVKLHSMSRRGV